MLQEREMDRPERWSARRKSEIVMRLLRGKDLGELSREIEVPPAYCSSARMAARTAGERTSPEASRCSGSRIRRLAAFSPGPTVTWPERPGGKRSLRIWRVPVCGTSQCESAGSDLISSVSPSGGWSKAVAAPAAEAPLRRSQEAANSAGVW